VNCDPIARVYRWFEYAAFGRELERRRFRYLAEVGSTQRALILGDGDGRFLARLLAIAPSAHVVLVDSSQRMLDLARRRANSPRVTCQQVDARTLGVLPPHFDLVATHFFFDCFDAKDLAKLIPRIAEAARPDATWLVSEFRQPHRGWRAAWAWIWLRVLYLFFRITTGLHVRKLTDHRPLLEASGFRLEQAEEVWFGLLASEIWIRRTAMREHGDDVG
jgi:ubiquinone/menaquinone biosynthesis C-methylase UbiE